jgi:hypothetical protein
MDLPFPEMLSGHRELDITSPTGERPLDCRCSRHHSVMGLTPTQPHRLEISEGLCIQVIEHTDPSQYRTLGQERLLSGLKNMSLDELSINGRSNPREIIIGALINHLHL